MSINKGTNNDPVNPYVATSSPINVAASLAPGSYAVKAGIGAIAGGSIVLSTNVTVIPTARAYMFMEF
jgi:hypothetical protein